MHTLVALFGFGNPVLIQQHCPLRPSMPPLKGEFDLGKFFSGNHLKDVWKE